METPMSFRNPNDSASHPSDYLLVGPGHGANMERARSALRQLVALRTHISCRRRNVDWMDGRPHPMNCGATWSSTGEARSGS